MQLIFTSGVPGITFLFTVLSWFTFSGNTDGRGEYAAVILATLVGVGTTWVEVKLSFSNIWIASICKKKLKYLYLFRTCNEQTFWMKFEMNIMFSTNICFLDWQGRSCIGSGFVESRWNPWPLDCYPLRTFHGVMLFLCMFQPLLFHI